MKDTTRIEYLLFLCNIIDDYEKFEQDLKNLLNYYSEDKIINNLNKLHSKKTNFRNKNIKSFYQKHKNLIDYIYKCTKIDFFVKNDKSFMESFIYFYKYVSKHKVYKTKMIKLLEKLIELGFTEVTLEEDNKFINEEYTVPTLFTKKDKIFYLENLEIIPNYQDNIVKYKSNGSNYKIKINNNHISIILNSLVFDINSLPKSLNAHDILKEITFLKDEQQDNCDKLKLAINMEYCIESLDKKIAASIKKISEENEDIINSFRIKLISMQEELEELQKLNDEYNDNLPDKPKSRLKKEYTEYKFFES